MRLGVLTRKKGSIGNGQMWRLMERWGGAVELGLVGGGVFRRVLPKFIV
jgi:hypothetical protein